MANVPQNVQSFSNISNPNLIPANPAELTQSSMVEIEPEEQVAFLLPPPYKEFEESLESKTVLEPKLTNPNTPFFDINSVPSENVNPSVETVNHILGSETSDSLNHLEPSFQNNALTGFQAPIATMTRSNVEAMIDQYQRESQNPTVVTYEAKLNEASEGQPIIPGTLQIDESGKLLKKYMAYHKFSGNLIESFDRWTLKILPAQLVSRQLIIRRDQRNMHSEIMGYVFVDDPQFYYSPHTPDYCRNHHITYTAKLKAKLYFYAGAYQDPPVAIEKQLLGEITLGLIPIMLGSWLDRVGKLENPDEKMILGECPFDPMGYFIISGSERQLVIQEKLRVNRFIIVVGDPKADKMVSKSRKTRSKPRLGLVGRMTCATIRGTSVLKLFENIDSTIDVSLSILGKNKDFRPISLGVYQVIRMLSRWYSEKIMQRISEVSIGLQQIVNEVNAGRAPNNEETHALYNQYSNRLNELNEEYSLTSQYSTIEAITQLICSLTNPAWVKKVRMELLPSETFARSHVDDFQMLAKMKEQPNLNVDQSEKFMILIDEVIFPQMPKEPALPRIQFLALLAAQMAERLAGLRPPDDRDAWMNKKMDTPAKSIEILWSGVWKKLFSDIQNKLDEGKLAQGTIINEFSKNYITEQFQNSFTSSNWGVQSSKMKENITDSLKRGNSIIGIRSALMRISSQTSKKIKVTNIRMIQGDQVGIVDMVETPEGSACLTLDTKILMANGIWVEIGKLKNNDMIMTYDNVTQLIFPTRIKNYFQRLSETIYKIEVRRDLSAEDGRMIEFTDIMDEDTIIHGTETDKIMDRNYGRRKRSLINNNCKPAIKAIRCTNDHPFMTNKGWVRADCLNLLKENIRLFMYEDGEIYHAIIEKIETCGEEMVADFTTDADTHTMISDNFVTHNCGIVKNKGLTCYVSQERNDDIVISRLTQSEKVYLSKIRTDTHQEVCLLNGKFMGWCDGTELAKECIKFRRQTIFPYDMCIGLKDNVLLLHTDGSRATRPLLIVNPITHKLVIEEKNMYHKPWYELITSGCVEYVDSLEQHYIYIAESMWALEAAHHDVQQAEIRVRVAEMLVNQIREELASDLYSDPNVELPLAIPQELMSTNQTQNLNERINMLQLDEAIAQLKQEQTLLRKLQRGLQYTHCEIDPQAILGVASSLGPMANRNQGPRNSYQCLALDEKILMADGTTKTMGDIADDDVVLTMNAFTHELEPSPIYGKFIRNPRDYVHATATGLEMDPTKKMYRVETFMDQSILCTGDHMFLTQFGYIEAKDLDMEIHFVAIYVPNIAERIITVPDWKMITIGNSRCLFIKIKSIEIDDEYNGLVGDFTTKSINHNFITEQGFITHNCAHIRQALGNNHSLIKTRMDTTTKALQDPTPPIFYNTLAEDFGLLDMPGGDTVIVALMVWGGYDQEDAIIMKQEAVERGMFRNVKYRTYETVLKKKANNYEEILVNPLQVAPYYAAKGLSITGISDPSIYQCLPIGELPVKPSSMSEATYIHNLANTGLPIPDCKVHEGDIIVGKLRFHPNVTSPTSIENISVKIGIREKGAVERAYVGYNGDNELIVNVKIRTVRMPQVGDKFSSRNAQKGTVGIILPASEMPWVGGNNPRTRGIVPDIIINPHALPSRMTMSMVIEIITSKVAAIRGEAVNATSYRPFDLNQFRKTLKEYNFDDLGNEIMMHPQTGQPLSSQEGADGGVSAQIFMGLSYYQQLSHHVDDKIQSRNVGRYDSKTRQPVKGRMMGGGLKFGEMERDTLISHGASYALVDTLCYRSDRFRTVYCTVCGSFAVNDIVTESVICRVCETKGQFGVCDIPFMFKYFTSQMAAVGIVMRQRFSRAEDKIPKLLPEPNNDPADYDE